MSSEEGVMAGDIPHFEAKFRLMQAIAAFKTCSCGDKLTPMNTIILNTAHDNKYTGCEKCISVVLRGLADSLNGNDPVARLQQLDGSVWSWEDGVQHIREVIEPLLRVPGNN